MARRSTFRVMQQKLGRENLFLGPSLFVGGEAGRHGLALEINPGRGIRQKSVEDDGALSEWSLLHSTVLLIL